MCLLGYGFLIGKVANQFIGEKGNNNLPKQDESASGEKDNTVSGENKPDDEIEFHICGKLICYSKNDYA